MNGNNGKADKKKEKEKQTRIGKTLLQDYIGLSEDQSINIQS